MKILFDNGTPRPNERVLAAIKSHTPRGLAGMR